MRAINLALALFVCLAAPLAAAEPPPIPDTPVGAHLRWALDTLNGAGPGPMDARFTPAFIEQVPEQRFTAILFQLRAAGPYTLVDIKPKDDNRLIAVVYPETARTHQKLFLSVEPDSGLLEGFLIQPAPLYGRPPPQSWNEIDAELDAVHGHANLGVYELIEAHPQPVHEHNADRALPIGSTFKLWILGALAEHTAEGNTAWDDTLAVRDALKSLPSGTTQNEPDGAEFPVSHFADLMISISDNTATDHLLDLVGRERVEAYMARFVRDPDANRPFLSTREMFSIKLGGDPDLLAEYAAADSAHRRGLLADLPAPSLLIASAWVYPVEIERIEWFATPRDLAATFADLHRLEANHPELAHALRINPGIPFDRDLWPEVAYKGGSEPGVLNMTWMVRRNDDRLFIVSLGWVDPAAPVDLNTLISAATRSFQVLADQ